MSRYIHVWGIVAGLALLGQECRGQMMYYPRGYGAYGWGGWGADPHSGYMAGLGAFARGKGVYEVDDAKAQAINLETMTKWNQTLRARQRQLREDKQQAAARRLAEDKARLAEMNLENGATLNDLLFQILDTDPTVGKASRIGGGELGANAVKEIPFEWDTEAVAFCLDQMLARDALPATLMDPRFRDERKALGDAVEEALLEDSKGQVSRATSKRVSEAIDAFRAKFVKLVPDTFTGYSECDSYLTTLASLTRLLHDPNLKQALVELDNSRNVTIGMLIAFMQTYNLRFGPASTERQIEIYRTLVERFKEVLANANHSAVPTPPEARGPNALPSAAKEAFKGMSWPQLDAHSRTP
jgi:hypothetical protein